jgi:hypothetical protein
LAFSALQAPAYQASVADYLDEDHCSRASGLIQLCHSAQHLFAALAAGLLVTLGRLHAVLLVDAGGLPGERDRRRRGRWRADGVGTDGEMPGHAG